jgi:1-acyl-sn-glycerol-3-phosphate acyltransferase
MKVFFRILLFPLSLFRFIMVWLACLVYLLFLLVEVRFFRRDGSFPNWSARNWGKTILFILGFVVKRNSFPPLKNYILMPNHRSYIDVLLMSAYSSTTFVGKAEVLKWPVIGQAMKYGRAIIVNRKDMNSKINTMRKIGESVMNGISVTVFPEGTTFKGPGILPFKNGTFKVAAELNIPIIPCAIQFRDAEHAWVDDDLFVPHFFRQMWKPVSHVEVRFGNPISNNNFNDLKEETKQAISAMLESMVINHYKNPE